MRTQDGVMAGKSIINIDILRDHLKQYGEYAEHEVEAMLNPADSQDVPRAVEFISAVASLGSESIPFSYASDPSRLQEAQIISVIGEMFASFMDLYITPDMTLTEQVISLVKFSHIAFILFRENRVNFMPNQLYGDMQTTVKNVLFCIAKQQEMDGTQPVYLFWMGDDRLEVLFGRARMQGGHNPNFSLKELVERLAAAVDLGAIFSRRPNLDRGARRLKVTCTEHMDHLNPESWTGDAIACRVDLENAWRQGQIAASAVLKRIGYAIDFNTLFDTTRVLDLMKPFGDGHYPGVAADFDRSQEPTPTVDSVTSQPTAILPAPADTAITSSTLPSSKSAPEPENPATADSEPYNTDDADASESTVFAMSDSDVSAFDSCLPASGNIDDGVFLEDLELTEALEDMQDEADGRMQFSPFNTEKTTAWLEYHGRKVHKASICRLIITPNYEHLSFDRLLRVRGYTPGSAAGRHDLTDSVLDADAFVVGDPYVTLIRCKDSVHLAVLKSIAVEQKGVRKQRVKASDLGFSAAGIKITGQIFKMRQVASGLVTTSLDDNTLAESGWVWTGNFVKLALDQKNPSPISGKSARKTLAVKTGSALCVPVNPRMDSYDKYSDGEAEPSNLTMTWIFSDVEMASLVAQLWDIVDKSKALSAIPRFLSNLEFPYRDHSSKYS